MNGIKRKALFHCWSVSQGDRLMATVKGETVALVENENGVMFEIKPNNLFFLDTEKIMSKTFKSI